MCYNFYVDLKEEAIGMTEIPTLTVFFLKKINMNYLF